jgi:hypothetical protein
MSTNQGSGSANVPSGAAEMAGEIQKAFGSMDTLAAQSVQTLQRVQQGRLARLSRALSEAKTQYPADSQEVKDAQAAVDATTANLGRVAMTHQLLTTPEPKVAADGWALHGRVFDAQLQPASGYTVFLVDDQKAYQQAFGFSYTDETGYFLINYPGPQAAAAGTPASGQAPKNAAAAPASQSAGAAQLFVEVADTKAQPVYLATQAFQPATGSPTYENIILPAGNQPIGDPPAAIRNVALPKKTKKPAAPPAGGRR